MKTYKERRIEYVISKFTFPRLGERERESRDRKKARVREHWGRGGGVKKWRFWKNGEMSKKKKNYWKKVVCTEILIRRL